MGQQPKELTPHRSPRHYWGAELRAWRNLRGLSTAALGRLVHLDGSHIAKVEKAERRSTASFAEVCDRALNAGGALVRLHALVVDTDSQGVVKPPDGGHHVANSGRDVANELATVANGSALPAPLETGDEITVPARTPDGRIIFVSVSRRLFLQGLGTIAAISAVGDPSSAYPAATEVRNLSHPAPDINPIDHFRELRRILIDSDNLFGPRGVVRTVQEQIGIMQQLRQATRGGDHQQLTHLQSQYAEFTGWLHQDLGDHRAAQYWTDRALAWSHVAGDPALVVYVLSRKSQLAGDMADDAGETIHMAEAAMNLARPRSRLAAVAATYAAHGYALAGDRSGCDRAYDRAHHLLGRSDDPESLWGVWLDEPYIEVQRARSLVALGDYGNAAAGFQAAIAALPAGYHRDHGVYIAREALAHAGAREAEHAAELGLQALAIGAETSSGRILTELARLDTMLAPCHTSPTVGAFREAMTDTVPRQV